MYKSAEDYAKEHKKGAYPNPGRKPVEAKSNSFWLNWAKHVYAEYCANKGGVGYCGRNPGGKESYAELRAYSRGRQSPLRYINQLEGKNYQNINEAEVTMQVSQKIVKIFPKFKNIALSKLTEPDLAVGTNANDETARIERNKKIGIERMLVSDLAKDFAANTGIAPNAKSEFENVNTNQELDMILKMGGIRLASEIMGKDAIDISLYEGGYETIESQLCSDILDFNKAAVLVYIEKSTGIVKPKYIDPHFLVHRSSSYTDCRDIDYAGFIEKGKTISQLRAESDLTEKDLYFIAKKYKKHGANRGRLGIDNLEDYGARKEYIEKNGHAPYDNFEVDEMTIYFLGSSAEKAIFQNKEGVKESPKSESQCVYSVKWIIGTRVVHSFGKEYGFVRQGANGAKRLMLPILIYNGATEGPSMTEKAVPFIDDIQLASLKIRDLLRKVPNGPDLGVDLSKMSNIVTIGGKNYNMLQMIGVYEKSGLFFYKSKSAFQSGMASQEAPIQPISNNSAEKLQLFLGQIATSVDMIREVTGLNPIMDGTGVAPDTLKHVAQGMEVASNNSLNPYFKGYKGLFLNMVKHMSLKWKLSVLHGDVRGKLLPLNSNIVRVATIKKDLFDYDLGITISVLPTREEVAVMFQDLKGLKEGGQITADVYFAARNMLNDKDFKKMQLFLSKAVQIREKEVHERNVEVTQAQAKAQEEAVINGERAKGENIRLSEEEKRKTMQLEYELKKEIVALEQEGQMAQKRLEVKAAEEGKLIDYSLQEN